MSETLLHATLEAARCAGRVALEGFPRRLAMASAASLHVEHKLDGSPVTAWDRAAERAARAWIEARFPEDGILGEELGTLRPAAARRWIIDPIDGTKSFIHGVPLWASLVAVTAGDRVIAGAACLPALSEEIAAAIGQGCWWNGARCAVSAIGDLTRATVLTTDARDADDPDRRTGWARLSTAAGLARSWGDAYGHVLVATGRAEVMVDPVLSAWDAAPFVPIVTEAGGVFTDWEGRTTHAGGSAISTNAALADEARRCLGAKVRANEETRT